MTRTSALRLRAETRPSIAFRLQDGGEFGAPGRHLADCAVEIDVRDQPVVAAEAHHVVDLDRLTIGFDDLALHDDAGGSRLLTGHLQLLAAIAVEAVGIDRRHIASEALA